MRKSGGYCFSAVFKIMGWWKYALFPIETTEPRYVVPKPSRGPVAVGSDGRGLRHRLPTHLGNQVGREHPGHDRLEHPVRGGRIEDAGCIARNKKSGTCRLLHQTPCDTSASHAD